MNDTTASGNDIRIRTEAQQSDVRAVREIAVSTGFFSQEEIDIAVELAEDRLSNGEASDYQFLFADLGEETVGFASFGRIPCTQSSFDLYWIAVHAKHQGRRIGKTLLAEVERLIAAAGGTRVYVETSSRQQYAPTRRFYEQCGYAVDAVQHDYYAPGDGKVTLVKVRGSAKA